MLAALFLVRRPPAAPLAAGTRPPAHPLPRSPARLPARPSTQSGLQKTLLKKESRAIPFSEASSAGSQGNSFFRNVFCRGRRSETNFRNVFWLRLGRLLVTSVCQRSHRAFGRATGSRAHEREARDTDNPPATQKGRAAKATRPKRQRPRATRTGKPAISPCSAGQRRLRRRWRG